MENIREDGFYWISIEGYGWTIGLYTNLDKEWSTCHGKTCYYDVHLFGIDENRIVR